MTTPSESFHEGELAVQRAAGESEIAEQNSVMISNIIVPGARVFLRTQQILVVASRDQAGRPWGSVVAGRSGFVSAADDGRAVTIDRSLVLTGDANHDSLELTIGTPLGLLAIDLNTRRRLRLNGIVQQLSHGRLVMAVNEAYPNCPKYIQRRELKLVARHDTTRLTTAKEGQVPDDELLTALSTADTAFVASGHPARGMDASHRGGRPGFIQRLADDLFRIPDYAGNSLFNTFGNLKVDPRCGLTILDFERGRLYQMTGEAGLRMDSHGPPKTPFDEGDTGRSWDFHVRSWRSVNLSTQIDWRFVDFSPYFPPLPSAPPTP